jgi:hypothetical protein
LLVHSQKIGASSAVDCWFIVKRLEPGVW